MGMLRGRFSHKTGLKWDHGLGPDIPRWSRSPKSLLGEFIPTGFGAGMVPNIQGKTHISGVGMRCLFILLPWHFPGRLSMDPSPGKPQDCHKNGNGRGQGAGRDLILQKLGKKMSWEWMQSPNGARIRKRRSGEWEFSPMWSSRGNSWWLRIPPCSSPSSLGIVQGWKSC